MQRSQGWSNVPKRPDPLRSALAQLALLISRPCLGSLWRKLAYLPNTVGPQTWRGDGRREKMSRELSGTRSA